MGAFAGNTFYFDFEVAFMEMLQRVLGTRGALFVSQFSALGETLVFVLVFGIFYWGLDKKAGIKIGTGLMVGLVLNPMIKNVFFRRRPYFDHESIKCLRPVEPDADIYDITAQGYSFPSGHSMNSVAVYGGVAKCRKEKAFKIFAVLFPLLVGFSRMAVGVHYPTDVLVGWIVGFVIIMVTYTVMDKLGEEKRWLLYLCLFAIGFVGIFYCKTEDFFSGLGLMAGFFLGIEFEERFVKFENTRNVLQIVLRVILGTAIFAGITVVLKLPFPKEVVERGDAISQAIRLFRYLVATFVGVGVYPLLIKKFPKVFG